MKTIRLWPVGAALVVAGLCYVVGAYAAPRAPETPLPPPCDKATDKGNACGDCAKSNCAKSNCAKSTCAKSNCAKSNCAKSNCTKSIDAESACATSACRSSKSCDSAWVTAPCGTPSSACQDRLTSQPLCDLFGEVCEVDPNGFSQLCNDFPSAPEKVFSKPDGSAAPSPTRPPMPSAVAAMPYGPGPFASVPHPPSFDAWSSTSVPLWAAPPWQQFSVQRTSCEQCKCGASCPCSDQVTIACPPAPRPSHFQPPHFQPPHPHPAGPACHDALVDTLLENAALRAREEAMAAHFHEKAKLTEALVESHIENAQLQAQVKLAEAHQEMFAEIHETIVENAQLHARIELAEAQQAMFGEMHEALVQKAKLEARMEVFEGQKELFESFVKSHQKDKSVTKIKGKKCKDASKTPKVADAIGEKTTK